MRAAALTFLVVVPLVGGAGFLWECLLKAAHLPTERQELVDLFTQTKSPALLGFMVVLALAVAPSARNSSSAPGFSVFCAPASRAGWHLPRAPDSSHCCMPIGSASCPCSCCGLTFAAAYERTGRIAVPMLAHALFNLNTLLLVLSGVGR